jgi:predicted RNA binding protein YcfA (HicA-like mRNA interferase family)
MSYWPSKKANQVYRTIEKLGWVVKNAKGGSHKQLQHPEWGEATWAFHESEEIGPKMMARIAKVFKFKPEDL